MLKSTLFRAYNALKKRDDELGRLNRALGLCQRKEQAPKYVTTSSYCSCPDFTFRRIRCKHIIALVMQSYEDK